MSTGHCWPQAFSLGAGWLLPLPRALEPVGEEIDPLEAPRVDLAITDRSGPTVVWIEYRVARHDARAFHSVM
ncbi:MFS transporter [Sphingobium sp. MI1205]|uniref:MFS transporter n=1 Tax=Sphingobium sp. MI1205 TaxID=407020 RepID=UPI0007704D4C|nr:MFS transporter [Sphingobium sp. MI1205]AMK19781.1 MFS permease [Sphingobium sp. MI1205]